MADALDTTSLYDLLGGNTNSDLTNLGSIASGVANTLNSGLGTSTLASLLGSYLSNQGNQQALNTIQSYGQQGANALNNVYGGQNTIANSLQGNLYGNLTSARNALGNVYGQQIGMQQPYLAAGRRARLVCSRLNLT